MSSLLEQIRLWIEQTILAFGYPGIALVTLIENILPPIPSEIVLPFSGFLVVEGELSFVGVLLASTTGSVVGAIVIYGIGARADESRLRDWFGRYGKYVLLSEEDFTRALNTFSKHGKKMVFIGRLIPGVRSLISLPAGLDQMNLAVFLFYTTLGTVIWNTLLAYGGIVLGRNWQRILDFINAYELILWLVLGLSIVIFVIRRLRQKNV